MPAQGWQRVEEKFLTDAKAARAHVLLQAGPAFKGTVWFDDLVLTEEREDSRPSGAWLNAVDRSVRTPHTAWAKPLPGKPLRVFCLLNNQGKRGLVELAQRMDIDFQAVVTPSPSLLGLRAGWTIACTWTMSSSTCCAGPDN